MRAFDVRFVTLKGVIEVVPRILNKGLIVKKVLREVAARHGGDGVDFVLCMGDDISDEKMFTAAFSFASEMDEDVTSVLPSPDVSGGDGDGAILATGTEDSDVPMIDEQPLKSRTSDDDGNALYMFTASVGKKPTHASNYVNDAWDVGSLLISLSGGDAESALQRPSLEGAETDQAEFFA
uniref:Trehalose 6-phosphate phosphatase n=1 Tax=Pseudictyota dubia TaxID=2749911 RepID=A0A7R9ZDK0_9STRA